MEEVYICAFVLHIFRVYRVVDLFSDVTGVINVLTTDELVKIIFM